METPVNRICPGWRSKVRAALAALGGATSGTSRGGDDVGPGWHWRARAAQMGLGQCYQPEGRCCQPEKGEVGSQPERGGRGQP